MLVVLEGEFVEVSDGDTVYVGDTVVGSCIKKQLIMRNDGSSDLELGSPPTLPDGFLIDPDNTFPTNAILKPGEVSSFGIVLQVRICECM